MIWDQCGRVHLYYIRSLLWCRIVRRRREIKKWLRHGRLMQTKTRIQFEIIKNLDQCGNWPRSPLLHKKFALMSDCEEEGGNKKWLRHGRLMQAKTRIQWPSRRINLRNNAQDRYLWLWRVTLLSMIWMWCLGPYFTTILCISTTCYSTKKPTFYYTKYFFIQVRS